jgi:translation elongation factor EF-Tu-like GTPase
MDNYELERAINSLEEQEAHIRKLGRQSGQPQQDRRAVQIGTVEQYFDKIKVVAITLRGELAIGDIIEIGGEDDAVRQRVDSMQIDRKDVSLAGSGDSVGIKLKYDVPEGAAVYRIVCAGN